MNTLVKNIGLMAWGALTGSPTGQNVTKTAITKLLDIVLDSKIAEATFNTVMLANNVGSNYKNTHGAYPTAKIRPVLTALQNATQGSPFISKANLELQKALIQPNLAGIPISSAKVETNKEVEISESMVIVQSKSTKQYQTDNAVPRLKEWIVTGYLTSVSPLDIGCLIKPTLQWQIFYLETCADSRRPVIFKTNRGEFKKVQITNLHTVEEASYNNGIEISVTLKEYNPYTIDVDTGINETASKQLIGGNK